ncbi:ribonuclease H-like domain-containing protein [Tanacetum coccineum]
MNELNNPITPHPTTPPISPPQPDTPPSYTSTPILTSVQTQSHAQMVDSHTPIPINISSQTMSTHLMVTRAKVGIFKPLEHMNCHVTTTSPLPRSHAHALRDLNWKEAMLDEYNALITNGTWVLVARPTNVNVLDVKNAFLHGHLSKTVYMHQPPGFVDPNKPNYVCHLQRSLYGLKQAPRAWFQRFASYATRVGFQHSKTDSSLFVFHRGSNIAYLLLYVDDIILTASSLAFLQRIIASLHKEILERAHMQYCNPSRTPVDTASKLGSDGDPVSDPTLYRRLACALQYLTFTRPYISYAVQHVTLSRSSAEAEYRGVENVVAETAWLWNLLLELHAPLTTTTLVYCDNVSAVYLSTNPVQHQRTKHIDIDIHFV